MSDDRTSGSNLKACVLTAEDHYKLFDAYEASFYGELEHGQIEYARKLLGDMRAQLWNVSRLQRDSIISACFSAYNERIQKALTKFDKIARKGGVEHER